MSEQLPPSPPGGGNRRSSITEMFMSRPNINQQSQSYSPPSSNTNIPSANAQSGRRGMSITTLGLSGANGQNTPLGAFAKQRRASIASSNASGSPEFRNSFEDSAVIEEDSPNEVPANTPASPSFSRRVSFGAQALRDVKGSIPASGGRHSSLFTTLQEQPENRTSQKKTSLQSSSATTRSGSRGLFSSCSRPQPIPVAH